MGGHGVKNRTVPPLEVLGHPRQGGGLETGSRTCSPGSPLEVLGHPSLLSFVPDSFTGFFEAG